MEPWPGEKPGPAIDVTETVHRTGLKRWQVIRFLKDQLPLSGLGTFKAGRRFKRSRFVWAKDARIGLEDFYNDCQLSSAFKAGSCDATAPDDLKVTSVVEVSTEAEQMSSPPITPIMLIDHQFQVRLGHVVHVQLPADLSPAEAMRLAEFVKTLPFQ
jgi:hypothetical protein